MRRNINFRRLIKWLLFLLLSGLILKVLFWSYTPKIQKHDILSISSLEKIIIGGVRQSICIHGKSIDNPVLLILHGGPGDAAMPMWLSKNSGLEEDYIVVNWDQRGAGKSYYSFSDSNDISIDTFVADALEITNYLRKSFQKEKIFLLGHSWGSVLSLKLIQNHPELFNAYIGVGQVVNMKESEHLSYNYTLKEAERRNDKAALTALNSMGNDFLMKSDWLNSLYTQRKLLAKYGGSLYGKVDYSGFNRYFLTAPEYSLLDIIKLGKGSKQSLKCLWPELMLVNFFETAPRVEIPIYFFHGKYDNTTSAVLLEEFFNQIEAPLKEIFWFDTSAHFPQWEEPEKFNSILKQIA